MKAIEFPEVNLRIAESQEQYETLPVNVSPHIESNGYFNQVVMCFELEPDERKRVSETGQIWHTVLVPSGESFNPILMSTEKPEI